MKQSGGSTMSRQLKVRLPNAAEMRQLRQILEESTYARLCRWAEALLFYGAGLEAQSIAEALWTNHLIFAQSKSFFRACAAPIIVRTPFDFSIRKLWPKVINIETNTQYYGFL